jgi:hypothetical protein
VDLPFSKILSSFRFCLVCDHGGGGGLIMRLVSIFEKIFVKGS